MAYAQTAWANEAMRLEGLVRKAAGAITVGLGTREEYDAARTSLNTFLDTVTPLQWWQMLGNEVVTTPVIPGMAAGGKIMRSGRAMVGERGPELVDLPRGAQVSTSWTAAGA